MASGRSRLVGVVARVSAARKKSPSRLRERGLGEEFSTRLERDLGRELHSARPAASQERVANADVAGGREREERIARSWNDCTPTLTVEAIGRRIRDEVRQIRIGEIRMIKDVEEISPNLQVDALR